MVRSLTILTFLLFPLFTIAAPDTFVFQGQIVKPDNTALEDPSVDFTIEIYSSTNECLLYRESFNSINMSSTNGIFNFNIGTGSRSGADYADSSNLIAIMDNSQGNIPGLTCTTGSNYDPSPGDIRKLRLTFNDGSGPVTVAQDYNIQSVPYAKYASSLQGLAPADFVQINTGSADLTQANLESIFAAPADTTELRSLIDGSSAQFISSSPGSAVNLNGQILENIGAPDSDDDAVNRGWVNDNIAGNDASGIGTLGVGEQNQFLQWDGSQWVMSDISTSAIVDGGNATGSAIIVGTNDAQDLVLETNNTARLTVGSNGGVLVDSLGVTGSARVGSQVQLQDGDTNYVSLQAPAAVAADVVFTLPDADGTSNQVLATNGSGQLIWKDDDDAAETDPRMLTLSSGEVNQLENIDTNTITNAQWSYLANMGGQPLESFTELDPGLQTLSTGEVDQLENIDTNTITNTQWGYLANMSGQPLESFTELDPGLQTLSTAEVDQLENIDTNTITNAQWGYLANMSGQPLESFTEADTLANVTGRGANTADDIQLDSQAELRLGDDDNSNYVGLRAPAGMTADQLFTLPATDGTSAQVLATDGSGNFYWKNDAGAGSGLSVGDIIRAADGAVGAPGLTFDNDQDTGLYSSAANNLAFTTGGTQRMVIPSDGTINILSNSITATQLGYLSSMSAQPLESFTELDPGLQTLSAAEVDQLENIDTNTITNAQWGYLANMSGQPLESFTESDPGLQTLSISEVDQLENIDTNTITNAQWGYLANMSGQPLESFTELDPGLQTLSSAEVDQLENIDTNTITNAQWGYLANMSGQPLESFTESDDLDTVVGRGGSTTLNMQLDNQAEMRFGDDDNSNFVSLSAPAGMSADAAFILPSADGTSNQVLATDGSGNFFWKNDAGAGSGLSVGDTIPAASGNAGAPGLTFDSDSDNGMYLSNTNEISLATAGTQRMVVDASGLVGIGTTPAASVPLNVYRGTSGNVMNLNADGNAYLQINRVNAVGPGTAELRVTNGGRLGVVSDEMIIFQPNGGGEVGRFHTNGYMALGTTIPIARLDVAGDAAVRGGLWLTDSDDSNYVGFQSPAAVTSNQIWTLPAADGTTNQILVTDGSGNLSWADDGGLTGNEVVQDGNSFGATMTIGTNDSQNLAFESANTTRMTIDTAGNIGVGTNAPASLVDARGNIDSEGLRIYNPARTNWLAIGESGGSMRIAPNSGNLRIHSTGFAWLTDPKGGANEYIYNVENTRSLEFGTTNSKDIFFTPAGDLLVTTGDMAIGSTVPGAKLDVNGNFLSRDEIRMANDANTNFVALKAPDAAVTSQTFVLPAADGTSNQVLATDGSGNFFWKNDAGAGSGLSVGDTIPAATGSVGAPGLTFDGDTDNGIYLSNTDEISFATAGTQRLVVDATGDVGIGTSTPATPMHIVANGSNIASRFETATDSIRYGQIETSAGTDFRLTSNNLDFKLQSNHRLIYETRGASWSWGHTFQTTNDMTYSSSGVTTKLMQGFTTWAPTADSGDFVTLELAPTINQTGTASGNYYGLVVRATETSVLGANNRLIDLRTNSVSQFSVDPSGNNFIGGESRYQDNASDNYVGFVAPATLTGNQIWTLPDADGTAGQVLVTDGSGNLSWATDSAADDLGDHIMDQNLQTNGNWINGDADNEGIFVDGTGNVGMGTNAPSTALHLNGDMRIGYPLSNQAHGLLIQNQSAANNKYSLLKYNGDGAFYLTASGVANHVYYIGRSYGSTGSMVAEMNFDINSNLAPSGFNFLVDNNRLFRFDENGDAAIGTTTPLSTLTVSEDVGSQNIITMNADSGGGFAKIGGIEVHRYNYDPGGRAAAIDFYRNGGAEGGEIAFSTNPGGVATQQPEERMRINDNGWISIGTTTPGAVLEVDAGPNNAMVLERDGTNEPNLALVNDGGNLAQVRGLDGGGLRFTNGGASAEWMRLQNTGWVGIGTNSPESPLHIEFPIVSAGTYSMVRFHNPNSGAGDQTRIALTKGNDVGTNQHRGNVIFASNGVAGWADYEGRHLSFWTRVAPGYAEERVRILNSGNMQMLFGNDIQLLDDDNDRLVSIASPSSITTSYTLTLPQEGGTAGQVLQTNGSGVLSWATPSGGSQWSINGSDVYYDTGDVGIGTTAPAQDLHVWSGKVQLTSTAHGNEFTLRDTDNDELVALSDMYGHGRLTINDSNGTGALSLGPHNTTTANYMWLGTGLTLSGNYIAQADLDVNGDVVIRDELRFNDSANDNYVGFVSPNVVTANQIWTLPDADGTNGQALTTNGSGVLSWTTPSGVWSLNGSEPYYNSGNVGIGTSDPAYTLDVPGGVIRAYDTIGSGQANFNNTGQFANFRRHLIGQYGFGLGEFEGSWIDSPAIFMPDSGFDRNSFTVMAVTNASDPAGSATYLMTVRETGLVGIGTTDPSDLLVVEGSSSTAGAVESLITNTNASGDARMTAENNQGDTITMQATGSSYANPDIATIFSTSGLSEMVLMTDGDLASGGSTPMTFRVGGFNSSNERMRIQSNGNVGIGTTTANNSLQVWGDIRVGTGTTGCVRDADGTNIAGTCSSDERFKKNIRDLGSVADKVALLKPSTFDWRADEFPDKAFGSEEQVGLIAQQVEQVFPNLVSIDDDGFYQVKYTDLNMYLLQAIIDNYNSIQKNQAMFEAMQGVDERQDRELASLKEENAKLKARVKELESDMAKIKKALNIEN